MSNPDTTRIFNYPEVTTPASDAKILLDSQTVGSKCIDANLFHCDLIDKTITQRGTFEASEDDADGFKKVVVDIPYTDVHVASGPIATFEGEDLPLKSLTASIVPVQSGSGDPSPTNVRPISGWSGIIVGQNNGNFWDGELEPGYIYNGTFYPSNTYKETKNYIFVKPNTTYKAVNVSGDGQIACYSINKTYISSIPGFGGADRIFTTPSDCYFIKFYNPNSYMDSGDISINYPSTDTDYHAYNGHTYSISFGQTVYSGTLDVTSGVLTVTHGYVDLGDYTYILSNGIFLSTYNFNAKSRGCDGACTIYTNSGDVTLSDMPNYSFQMMTGTYGIAIRNDDYNDATAFKTAMEGKKLVYELKTPITYQLTPTAIKSLDGVNNVFADTGDVDVEYQTVWVRPTE